MRALIVDDDAFDRETCREALETASWEVVEATDPEEAHAALEEEAFDAIISDYDLKSSQNGLDVLDHAMRARPEMKRILMSGFLPPNVLQEASECRQVEAFIEKADTPGGWRDALARVLPSSTTAAATAGRMQAPTGGKGQDGTTTVLEEMPRERSLEERIRWLNAVVELGNFAHAGVSLQETFDRAVQVVSDTLGMEYTKILQLLPGGDEVLLVAGVGWKPGLVGKARVSTGMESQAGYTLASEHPVLAEDLRAETRFSGPTLLHEHGVVSGVSVVIPGDDGRPWGVFGAHTTQHRRLTEDHGLFLQAVANVVAGAITRDRTEDTLRNTKSVLEREVDERTRELREAVDDLQAFNAMVAHDLHAPLRMITLSLHRFLEAHRAELEADAKRPLETAIQAAGQMRSLLEDLLALAKATRDPLKMEDVDLTAMVRDRWAHVQEREPERDVDLHVQEGLTARADPRLLAVVLDNLLGNALKFTRNTPDARIEVGAEHLPVGGTALYVRDNGAGFPQNRAKDLFHPFKRLHSTSEFEGTGIGLTTVRRILERHRGSVWAESEGPGKGATIHFRLLPSGLP